MKGDGDGDGDGKGVAATNSQLADMKSQKHCINIGASVDNGPPKWTDRKLRGSWAHSQKIPFLGSASPTVVNCEVINLSTFSRFLPVNGARTVRIFFSACSQS